MNFSYLIPFTPGHLQRVRDAGLSAIQLRLGPGHPIDTADESLAESKQAAADLRNQGVAVHALGYYRNHLHPDPAIREDDARRLQNVLRMATLFGTDLVGVFAGRDPEKTIEENIPTFREVWTPLARAAESEGVRIAFENCTMFRGYPVRGINIAHTPEAYRLMFEAVPSPALGMEFDPSHCIKQYLDPVQFVREFGPRVFHIHAKDHEILPEELQRHGVYDVRTSRDRLPGKGQVDFPALFAELRRLNYRGQVTIEGEKDPDFPREQDLPRALRESAAYLAECYE